MTIRSLHESNGHIGPRHTLSCLRQKYWIINGLQACKSAVSACIECRRQRQLPMRQQMADLPPERLTPDKPPFAYTCIDFVGPFLVRVKRSRVKRCGCLFSCMTTRAVHLEVTHTLDTDSFVCAFTRFIARRGKPEKVFSDNGTNLVSGSKELRVNIQEFNRKHINDKMLQMDVYWHFNPPHASHMGGVWERLVKSVRTILNTVTRQQTLTDETLITFITEVEGILNSRTRGQPRSQKVEADPLSIQCLLEALGERIFAIPTATRKVAKATLIRQTERYCNADGRKTQYTCGRYISCVCLSSRTKSCVRHVVDIVSL